MPEILHLITEVQNMCFLLFFQFSQFFDLRDGFLQQMPKSESRAFCLSARDDASLAKIMPRFGALRLSRHRRIDMGMHAVTHAVFSQLCTSYNSLSGFET